MGIAFDGTHMWVVNFTDSSLTELNTADGSWVRTLTTSSCASYGFDYPEVVAFDGTHMWVTNAGNSVTDLPAG